MRPAQSSGAACRSLPQIGRRDEHKRPKYCALAMWSAAGIRLDTSSRLAALRARGETRARLTGPSKLGNQGCEEASPCTPLRYN
eukprot:365889-Chlamydomonas_euryale.AAC.7